MKKTLEWWGSRGYLNHPKVSFLVETHDMSGKAIAVIRSLRKYKDAEIIVMDDGSSHNHTKALLDEITGVNEFLLHFNDLFVVLTQSRAVGFARGEFVVKMQDDDVYDGQGWVDRALALFEQHPDLAVIGGRGAMELKDSFNWADPVPWRPVCEKFEFVSAVNEAPMWIRRSDFMELGGFDEDFGPKYWGEQELCFRAWLAGKSVGWYPSGTKICAIPTAQRRRAQMPLQHAALTKNRALFREKFAGVLPRVNELVRQRNREEG